MSDKSPFDPKKQLAEVRRIEKAKAVPSTPKDRRLPLASAKFRIPIPIPGCAMGARSVTSHEEIPLGNGAKAPQLFLDPELRVICIGDVLIPFDGSMVESVVRAKAAK